jgi:protein phosphatase
LRRTRDDRHVPDSIELRVPDPCLVVLVGPAGAGKTSFAARHFARDEVLSSDAFRALIAGDPTDQRATAPAFAVLHRTLRLRLSRRLLTVVDATSVGPADRRPLVRIAEEAGVAAVAIVLDLPDGIVLTRNEARGGLAVPEAAVRRHLARLATSLRGPGLAVEGFAQVVVLREPADVDAVRVLRVGPTGVTGVAGSGGGSADRAGSRVAGPATPSSSRARSARSRRP